MYTGTLKRSDFTLHILGSVRSKTMLCENSNFRSIYDELTNCFGSKPDSVVLCTQKGGTQHSSKEPILVGSLT